MIRGDPNDPHIYSYGHTGKPFANPPNPAMQYVARAPVTADPSNASSWAFYNGALGTWSAPGAPASSAMPSVFVPGGSCNAGDAVAPFDALSVTAYPSATTPYLASAKPVGAFSPNVVTWSGPTPAGPWTCGGSAVNGLPDDLGHTFTYGGHVMTGVAGASPMLIWSQNHNPLDPDVIANSQLYKAFYAVPAAASLP